MILVKEGMGYRFYSGDLKFRMDSVSPQSDGRLRIGGEYFYRLDRDTTLEDWGVLEQLLFAGHYQRPGVTTGTVFHPNGQVEGLDSFYYYAAVIDYSDFYNRYDRVRLGGDPKHLQTYAFRIRQDTMMIYALDCRHYDQNHECDSEVLGDRLYALPGGGRWN